jgi:hypothetical protein
MKNRRFALAAALVLGVIGCAAIAAPAGAAWYGDGRWHQDNRWNSQNWSNPYYGYYYRAPPVVYATPYSYGYVAPPVIYDATPGFSITITP